MWSSFWVLATGWQRFVAAQLLHRLTTFSCAALLLACVLVPCSPAFGADSSKRQSTDNTADDPASPDLAVMAARSRPPILWRPGTGSQFYNTRGVGRTGRNLDRLHTPASAAIPSRISQRRPGVGLRGCIIARNACRWAIAPITPASGMWTANRWTTVSTFYAQDQDGFSAHGFISRTMLACRPSARCRLHATRAIADHAVKCLKEHAAKHAGKPFSTIWRSPLHFPLLHCRRTLLSIANLQGGRRTCCDVGDGA